MQITGVKDENPRPPGLLMILMYTILTEVSVVEMNLRPKEKNLDNEIIKIGSTSSQEGLCK